MSIQMTVQHNNLLYYISDIRHYFNFEYKVQIYLDSSKNLNLKPNLMCLDKNYSNKLDSTLK